VSDLATANGTWLIARFAMRFWADAALDLNVRDTTISAS